MICRVNVYFSQQKYIMQCFRAVANKRTSFYLNNMLGNCAQGDGLSWWTNEQLMSSETCINGCKEIVTDSFLNEFIFFLLIIITL